MDIRMTPLETRFDTKLPTLVTKVDLKQVEIRLANLETRFETILPTLATKKDLNYATAQIINLEHKLTATIHREINSRIWKMTSWMTFVMCAGFGGVFFIARYVAP
jgi:hypothetical protein